MSKIPLESHFTLMSSDISHNLVFSPYFSVLLSGMLSKQPTIYDRLFFRINRRINGNLFGPLDRKYASLQDAHRP